jgi:hypothetical protein
MLLLALAFVVHLGVTTPAREAALGAEAQLSSVFGERRDASRQLVDLEKRAQLLNRAGLLVTHPDISPEKAVQDVRSRVVRSLRDAKVVRVHLVVQPAPSPALASVSLSADGGFFDLTRLLLQLSRPGSGVVLGRVSLASTSLTVDGFAFGAKE